MNKIEKIMVKPIDELNSFSYYDCNRESQRAKDNHKIAQKSAEITTDIAIKFAEWIADTKIHGYSKQLYEAMIIHKVKTTEELFQVFIDNHYGKE